MTFPTSPSNGQQVTLNYVTYQYDSANTAWYRVTIATSEPLANFAFTQANTATLIATSGSSYANSAYVRANNSLNVHTGGSITGDTTITGNLTVTGTHSTFITPTLRTSDHIIDVGYGTTGAPSNDAGIRVVRGDENPVQIRWVEASDHWEYTNDGASYIKIGSESDGIYANAAFAKANTGVSDAGGYANAAFGIANSASSYANSAFAQANNVTAASSYANGAFAQANTAFNWGNHASAGYASITYVNNEVANLVNSAPSTLNTLNELATALGNDANFSTTISTMVGVSGGYANASFSVANSASSYANGAFAQANNVTAASSYANSGFVTANSASSYANAAFAKANTGVSGGIIFTSSSTVPATANVGDQWYSTNEDVLYEYLDIGDSNTWVDITGPSVKSNTYVQPSFDPLVFLTSGM